MIVFWVLLHGFVAIALIGAITHQGLSVWRSTAPARLFIDRFRAVPGRGYVNAVVALYLVTFAIGAFIYPTYVLDVKGNLVDAGLTTEIGLFQIKEHVTVIGLTLLAIYWQLWQSVPQSEGVLTRKLVTTLLMIVVWWSLFAGHFLNNIRGLT